MLLALAEPSVSPTADGCPDRPCGVVWGIFQGGFRKVPRAVGDTRPLLINRGVSLALVENPTTFGGAKATPY